MNTDDVHNEMFAVCLVCVNMCLAKCLNNLDVISSMMGEREAERFYIQVSIHHQLMMIHIWQHNISTTTTTTLSTTPILSPSPFMRALQKRVNTRRVSYMPRSAALLLLLLLLLFICIARVQSHST